MLQIFLRTLNYFGNLFKSFISTIKLKNRVSFGALLHLIVPHVLFSLYFINYDIHRDDLNEEKNNFHIYFITQQSILKCSAQEL